MYVKLEADTSTETKHCLIKILKQLNNKGRFDSQTYKSIYPMAKGASHFYATIKVHKK